MTGREKAAAWREAARAIAEHGTWLRGHQDPAQRVLGRHIRDVIVPSLLRQAERIERRARS